LGHLSRFSRVWCVRHWATLPDLQAPHESPEAASPAPSASDAVSPRAFRNATPRSTYVPGLDRPRRWGPVVVAGRLCRFGKEERSRTAMTVAPLLSIWGKAVVRSGEVRGHVDGYRCPAEHGLNDSPLAVAGGVHAWQRVTSRRRSPSTDPGSRRTAQEIVYDTAAASKGCGWSERRALLLKTVTSPTAGWSYQSCGISPTTCSKASWRRVPFEATKYAFASVSGRLAASVS